MTQAGRGEEALLSGWAAVPRALVLRSKAWSEEELRLLLYFFGAESVAQERGVSVPFAELAEHTGLGPDLARLGLENLAQERLVTTDGCTAWRRLPADADSE